MTTIEHAAKSLLRLCLPALVWAGPSPLVAGAQDGAPPSAAIIVSPTTEALVRRDGTRRDRPWGDQASTNAPFNALGIGDRVRTLENGRATIRLGEKSLVHLDRLSVVEILPPRANSANYRLDLSRGLLYLLHRGRPSALEVQTRSVNAAIEGTDFAISVDEADTTVVTLIDGHVRLFNDQGSTNLNSGDQGTVKFGQPPVKTSVLNAINVVQWSLYYPGVLDPEELKLDGPGNGPWDASLTAYRDGDLIRAFDRLPDLALSTNANQRLYQAALLLAVGQVTNCEALVRVEEDNPLAAALRNVIAAVKTEELPHATGGSSPSQLLGFSYYQQSRHDLAGALKTAQRAVALSTNFGFGWERVAELEFSFGRVPAAERALKQSLHLAPRNPQAHALRGFLLAADNRIAAAIAEFDAAIELDGNLANAWLGRGLCLIKRGQAQAGFQDLQTAAVLEPTRSLLRSYLAKAFLNAGDELHARQELALAQDRDKNDPTPWLYLALLDYEENHSITAINDLQRAAELNTNREVYRSKLLLDRDRAVANTSLAKIYQDVGMNEVSVAEASRAVDYDYANYSAHLFLADSLNALRDPTRFNLRYETAWFNELLLANLLAPVGARPLSQNISQQEYSRLFDADRLGLDTTSEYRSDGQFQELASQYGARGQTSYSLDLDYQHNDGIRPNNGLSDIEWYSQVKQQIGPNDAVTLFTKYENYHSGDNFQYNTPTNARPFYKFDEYQTPILVGAYHHEWGPDAHTLLLVGRLANEQTITDPNNDEGYSILISTPPGTYRYAGDQSLAHFSYDSRFTIYTAELNQLFQGDYYSMILGGRVQDGQFATADNLGPAPLGSTILTNVAENFERFSTYAYCNWQLPYNFLLTTGLTYDHMTYPDNFRFVPITSGLARREQVSPKLALTWTPQPDIALRAACARALGGASFDESFTLEPTQIAGFNQAFRSVISESVVGSLAGPRYDIFGGAVDMRVGARTFLTLQTQLLKCQSQEDVGVIKAFFSAGPSQYTPGTVSEQLHYTEPSVALTVNQLLDDEWAAGAQYRFTRSQLNWFYPAITSVVEPSTFSPNSTETATLHQVSAHLQYANRRGFYARAEAQWYLQSDSGQNPQGTDPPLPRNEFTQVNVLAGYRFWRRRGDATFGILNVGGGDYSLNPLNVYNELPHSRVFMGRIRLTF